MIHSSASFHEGGPVMNDRAQAIGFVGSVCQIRVRIGRLRGD